MERDLRTQNKTRTTPAAMGTPMSSPVRVPWSDPVTDDGAGEVEGEGVAELEADGVVEGVGDFDGLCVRWG